LDSDAQSIIPELSQKDESESQPKVEVQEPIQKLKSRENNSPKRREEEYLEEIESDEENN